MDLKTLPAVKPEAIYALGYITGYAIGVSIAILAVRQIAVRQDRMIRQQAEIATRTSQLHALFIGARYNRPSRAGCPGGCS